MGLCFRRPHECVLPLLFDAISRSTVLGSRYPQEQLDMFVRVEHAVLGGVCSMPTSVSSPTHAALSFAQYIYGVYLGLNSTSRYCTFRRLLSDTFPRSSAIPCTHGTLAGTLVSPFCRVHSIVVRL